jgi:hypothetical protein
MPDGQVSGTLITVAPAAGPIGHLLRTAIDAEQVGATRLHLSATQPDLERAVSALREQTTLIITCDATPPIDDPSTIDVITSDFADAVVREGADLPAVVAEVAHLVSVNPGGVSISGRGAAALPALLAALAAGGHIWVEAPEYEDAAADRHSGRPRDHVALVARACGLARIAGRPPLDARAARRLLGLR